MKKNKYCQNIGPGIFGWGGRITASQQILKGGQCYEFSNKEISIKCIQYVLLMFRGKTLIILMKFST